MGFQINTNLGALKAYNALATVNAQTEKAQLRLASQKKINTVADDTSGFNVGKKLEAQVATQKSQLGNISSAQNYLATAESALQEINDKINQIAAKQTDSADQLKDGASIAKDIRTLASEISSILKSTNINGNQLLASTDGSTAVAAPTFNVGGSTLTFDFGSSDLGITALSSAISTTSLQNTTDATVLGFDTSAIASNVRTALGKIGNLNQALSSRQDYLTNAISNNTATISNLFDADMAAEQLNSTKGQIGSQVATAMLSQLNTAPQNLLSLFK